MSYYKPPQGAGGGAGPGGITVLSGQYQTSGIYPASGIYQISGIYPASGIYQLSGIGTAQSGSSFVGGIAAFSGNGSGTTYIITHGLGTTPTKFTAIPNSLDAMGDYRVEASGNTLSVIYTTARPSGASNINLGWMADSQIVSGGVLGNNILVGGTAVFSGNTSGTTFLITHNIGVTPSRYGVVPSTVDAVGDYRVEASGNNLSVIYTAARASGDSNIGLVWFADTNNVSGGPANPLNVGALNVSGTAVFSGNVNIQGNISGTIVKEDYTYLVFQDSNGSYQAKRGDTGVTQFSGAEPEFTIGKVLSVGGQIKLQPNTGGYTLSSGFSGFGFKTNTTFDSTRVVFLVPNNYSGIVFDIPAVSSNLSEIAIKGATVSESGFSGNANWIGLKLSFSGAFGIYDSRFEDLKIANCKVGVNLVQNASGGYITNNTFRGIKVYSPKVGYLFENNVSGVTIGAQNPQIANNTFDSCMMQSYSGTSGGFIDMMTHRNVFLNCQAWDISSLGLSGAVTSRFHQLAFNNLILGGIMTNINYSDAGSGNWVVGDFGVGFVGGSGQFTNLVATSGINSNILSPKVGAGASTINIAAPQSGTFNVVLHPGSSGGVTNLIMQGDTIGNTNQTSFTLQYTASTLGFFLQRLASGASNKQWTFANINNVNGTTIGWMNVNQSGEIIFNQSGGTIIYTSGKAMGLSGQGVMSFASGYMNLSGLNFLGTTTSGASAGSGSVMPSGVQTWLQINVSGVLMKIPAFNV